MVGKRIRELRKQRGMTLRELSDELRIPFTTLGNYERNDRQPSIETLQAIADHFSVTIDYLSSGSKNKRQLNLSDEAFQQLMQAEFPELTKEEFELSRKFNNLTELLKKNQNEREMKIISEIIEFLFQMKINSSRELFSEVDSTPLTKNEYASIYIKKKHHMDGSLNELFEIYYKELK
ncbi:helix-turn-helix transcriptional regulator [Bacillus sp. RG28]|uniref:Helix-turn-helix transcriptional regulator n=1 Tax=Gottfriedia endophytica TaxID=2820819 RepID=A0A940SKT4_9BACI|nr:helix-turn-helix transcriptional regulator [Gottfriedia endophytica]MBP0726781.1 helix-turn-helix transcriptional regulator [Gottfriedia endophytica]